MSPKKGSRRRVSRKPKKKQKPFTIPKDKVKGSVLEKAIRIDFGSLKFLLELGFVIPAEISVPLPLREKMLSIGLIVPRPVEGYMLVDTGASWTCLCKSAIRKLNLHPTTSIDLHGAHGTEETYVYYATVRVGEGEAALYKTDQFAEVNLTGEMFERYSKQGITIIGLLGRDYFADKILTCDFVNQVMIIQKGSK